MNAKQLTVLTGNSARQVSDVISHLGGEGVDIRAHCLVDNGDGHCKLRMIVSQPERAVNVLQDRHITAVVNDVVVIETDDKPGSLSRMLEVLKAEDVEIEYTYTAASQTPGTAVMVFRFSDNPRAVKALEKAGHSLAGG
jgi:hypothetical protein